VCWFWAAHRIPCAYLFPHSESSFFYLDTYLTNPTHFHCRAYRSSRENIITVNQHMLRELENNVFILGDLEISIEEIPLLCKFMSSKDAQTKIRTLVVSRKYVNAMSVGRKATVIQTNKQSSLLMNKCKLQLALVDFIAHCSSLEAIIFDSVSLKPEIYGKLGNAMTNARKIRAQALRHVAFRNVAMGTQGLRALTPCLGQLSMQRLELDKVCLGLHTHTHADTHTPRSLLRPTHFTSHHLTSPLLSSPLLSSSITLQPPPHTLPFFSAALMTHLESISVPFSRPKKLASISFIGTPHSAWTNTRSSWAWPRTC
jgi:hypothetical protein